MKQTAILTLALLLSFSLWAAGPATILDQIKDLDGDWEGTFADGTAINVSYSKISGDTAVMETFRLPNGTEMRSVYHMNGDKLMMTHYCESGNQPRLQGNPGAGSNDIKLSFLDITNAGPLEKAAYLYRVELHLQDKDAFTQDITWMIQGKETTNTLKLTRKK